MRVLVTWGSRRGATEGIARTIGEQLRRDGLEVVLEPASAVREVRGYDAAVVGGALYANKWHRSAYHLLTRNIRSLRSIPVWLFSSGPLDDSADYTDIPPVRQLAVLVKRVGALGHATFGGRLTGGAKGFPASAMAKKRSGDWRNQDRIRVWAAEIARTLPTAQPGPAHEPAGRSLARLLGHGIAGWALCAAAMAGLLQVSSMGVALIIHAIAAPLLFAAVSVHYFRSFGARDPLPVAPTFVAIVIALDAGVAGIVFRNDTMFRSFAGTWLPFVLIFLATWVTGEVMTMLPAPESRSEV